MQIKMGIVEKVIPFTISKDVSGQGTFAGMASHAASAVSPGLIAEGTSSFASNAGSLMDSKVQTIAKLRIRIRMDNGELIEVVQNDIPGISFKEGDRIVITSDGKDGNVWPD